MRDRNGVREERNGWRDPGISLLHRDWGSDCPVNDFDWIVMEYDQRRIAALVEYKRMPGRIEPNSANIETLVDLANNYRGGVPAFGVVYTPDYVCWEVIPLNQHARSWVNSPTWMFERDYVSLLYRIRQRTIPTSVAREIANTPALQRIAARLERLAST